MRQQWECVSSVDAAAEWMRQQSECVSNVIVAAVWMRQQCEYGSSVNAAAVWMCQQCECGNSVNAAAVCRCSVTATAVWMRQQCECVSSVNAAAVSVRQQCECVSSVNVSAVWMCQQCECGSSVNVAAVWMWQQCGCVSSANVAGRLRLSLVVWYERERRLPSKTCSLRWLPKASHQNSQWKLKHSQFQACWITGHRLSSTCQVNACQRASKLVFVQRLACFYWRAVAAFRRGTSHESLADPQLTKVHMTTSCTW